MAAECASPARLHAVIHLADLFAILGTGITDSRTSGTYLGMQWRRAQHEIGSGAADFRTIHHQPEVFRLDMPATRLQAMAHRHFLAGAVTVKTFIDALLHLATR